MTKVINLVSVKESPIDVQIKVLIIIYWFWENLAYCETQNVLHLNEKVELVLFLNYFVIIYLLLKR